MSLFKDPVKKDDNLALPLEIDGGHWDGTFRRFLLALSFFAVALIVLSIFAPVREVAHVEGEIIPIGSVVAVEHLEGGIVDRVFVGEGGLVKKGEVLLQLRSESGSGDFNQVKVRRDLLEMRRLRLHAHLSGTNPDFGELTKEYPREAKDQRVLFLSEQKTLESGASILQARRAQRIAESEARKRELAAIGAQIKIFEEQLSGQQKLLERGYSSRGNLLRVQAQLEEVRVSEAQLAGAIETAKASIVEIESEIQQAKDSKQQEWSDNLIATIGEISELEERLKSAQDRVSRLAVYAPKTGLVQSLAATVPGQVISPGDVVAEIVPVNASVEAEVRILPRDIGHIQPGHPAEITLSTFDPEVFGKIHGSIRSISPTTFQTEQGDKYYKGLIGLDRNKLEYKGQAFEISAGMVVSASVRTGSKTVMQYIMKPVVRSYDRAFSER